MDDARPKLSPTEVRLRLLGAGHSPLPLQGKVPTLKDWQRRERTNAEEIRIWGRMWPYALNTGALTRRLPCLDLDLLDPEAADAASLLVAGHFEDHTILTRFGRSPKRAIPFRLIGEPFAKITRPLVAADGSEQRVEFLAAGQQLVVHGVHPETLRPYSWHGGTLWDVPLVDLPGIDAGGARILVDAVVTMLVDEHGYRLKGSAVRPNKEVPEGWPGLPDLIDHDALTAYAMRLLKSGMNDGAAVNMLRAMVSGLTDIDEERRERRLTEIPGMVSSARAKIANGGDTIVQIGGQLVEAPESVDDDWPEPDLGVLQLHRRQAPPCPLEIFGDRWASWIETNAEASACPVDYVVGPLLAAASTVIGNARWARAGKMWAEPPHLWCASVGDSGDGKSPGADVVNRHILPEIERRMTLEFPDQLCTAQAAIEIAKARHEAWKAEVKAAVKDGRTPPSAPKDPIPEEPISPHLTMSDVTVERVAMILARAAPKGVLMTRDELAGFLVGMTAYNDGARAFWIEAYGGRAFRVDRVKHPEPIIVPRLAVAWQGGIQPERLAEVMREADDGLLSRFMWLWPEPVEFHITDSPLDVEWAVVCFDRLRMLELASDSSGVARPLMVPLTAAAVRQLERFGRELQERKETAAGLMRSAIGKARGLALRVSNVLQHLLWAADDGYLGSPEVIEEGTLLAAARFVRDYVLPMDARTYGDAACTQKDRNTATLARWLAGKRPPAVHVREMQRKIRLPGLTTAEAIHDACESLVEHGWLGRPAKGQHQQRAVQAYPISPRLWEALP